MSMESAQWAYDSMLPPEPGPCRCERKCLCAADSCRCSTECVCDQDEDEDSGDSYDNEDFW